MSGQGKARFTGKAPEYRWHWFLPASKLVKPVPVKVWATTIPDGWQGWLESQRKRGSVIPTVYLKTAWKETTEVKAEKAREAAKQAQATANVGPAAKHMSGKEIREAATAAGKAERAGKAKPGPVKVASAPVTPEPEPTPTGTDPAPAAPGDLEGTLTAAVQLHGPTETLQALAKALKLTGPGLRKALPAPVKARKAGGKR